MNESQGFINSGDIVGEIVGQIVGLARTSTPNMARHSGHGHPQHHGHHGHPQHPAGFHPPVIEYKGFEPHKMRKSQVGVPLGQVPGGLAIGDFVTQPQKPFRPERLVIPSSIGPAFTLNDFKVGNVSQFVSSNGDVPALAYAEWAVGVEILSDTAFISQFLTLAARNISSQPQIFSSGFFGTSAELGPLRGGRGDRVD